MRYLSWILLSLLLLTGCAPSGQRKGMDMYTFSVGKADAHLLSFDGVNVLIDTGEEDDGDDIVKALSRLGVDSLDLVILTHYDKDHIGGFPEVCRSISVASVIMPDYVRSSDYYRAMEEAIAAYHIPARRISSPTALSLQGVPFTIYTSTQAYDPEEQNDNELSLITALTYGQVKLLYMGDAEDAWLNDLCYQGYDLSCQVLKFPHHGKWQKEVTALLALSLPDYAIITDSDKNPAADKTLDALRTLNIPALRTAQGDVHLYTDGVTVRMP